MTGIGRQMIKVEGKLPEGTVNGNIIDYRKKKSVLLLLNSVNHAEARQEETEAGQKVEPGEDF